MSKSTMLIAFALVTAISSVAHAARTLTPVDNGTTLAIKKGQQVRVRLPYFPSSGYQWKIVAGKRAFGEPSKEDFIQGKGIGALGAMKLTWKTPKTMTGTHSIKLGLIRSWEKNTKPVETFSFKVKITK